MLFSFTLLIYFQASSRVSRLGCCLSRKGLVFVSVMRAFLQKRFICFYMLQVAHLFPSALYTNIHIGCIYITSILLLVFCLAESFFDVGRRLLSKHEENQLPQRHCAENTNFNIRRKNAQDGKQGPNEFFQLHHEYCSS